MFDDFFAVTLIEINGQLVHAETCCCMACWQGEVRLSDDISHAEDCQCIGCYQQDSEF